MRATCSAQRQPHSDIGSGGKRGRGWGDNGANRPRGGGENVVVRRNYFVQYNVVICGNANCMIFGLIRGTGRNPGRIAKPNSSYDHPIYFIETE